MQYLAVSAERTRSDRYSCVHSISKSVLIQSFVLIFVLLSVTDQPGIAQSTKVYWSDFGLTKIQKADVDGSNVETVLTSATMQPFELDVDGVNDKLYWTETLLARIQRSDLDGSNVETLLSTGLVTPRGLALDVANGKMYWTDWGTFKIQRADLDGSNVEDLIDFGALSGAIPRGIVLDVAGGKMYWTDAGLQMIRRANLDGSGIENLITVGLNTTVGIDLDTVAGKLYWTDLLTGTIHRANLDGSGVETIVSTGLLDPSYIDVDPVLGKIFWTDFGTTWVQRANLDGTGVENIVTSGLIIPTGIALESSAPLPVEMTSFEAVVDESEVVLRWETASETNSSGFDVEVKQQGQWTTRAFVNGAGNSTTRTEYEYRIGGLDAGRYSFRLRQVDFDGSYAYSDAIEAIVEVPGGALLAEIYPNPFSTSTTLRVGVASAQDVRVVVYDIQGREVRVPFQGWMSANDPVEIKIDSQGLSAGVYLVQIQGESRHETRRMVLAR